MRTHLRNALWGALIGGGIAVLSITAASAAETDGEDSILGGTQALLGIELPLELSGNAISVLGDSESGGGSSSAPDASTAPAEAPTTSGTDGVGSGTQAVLPIELPIAIEGNSISLLGDASSGGGTPAEPANQSGGGGTADGATTDGTGGTLAGTQIAAPLSVPLTFEDNAISVLGDTSTGGPGAVPGDPGDPVDPGTPGDPTDPGTPSTPPSGSGGPAAVTGTAALAVTGTDPASPWLAWAAAGLGLLLIGARRALLVLRR